MTNSTFILTAYCACTLCCGRHANGITASGTKPRPNYTVACNFLPFGTLLCLEGFPHTVFKVEDRMNVRYTNRIDIYMQEHSAAKKFGIRRNVRVTVTGKVKK